MDKIILGDTVKDHVSDFTGVVIGRAEYMFLPAEVLVQSKALNTEGKAPSEWFDEVRVGIVKTELST
jgi:hypothetical protein